MSKPTLEAWVALDHTIERKADNATLALMEHRWKAVNEGGFSVKAYARALGRAESTVGTYVRGWNLHLERGPYDVGPPGDLLALAKMGVEAAEAAEIVARATGLPVSTVRKAHDHVVREVRSEIDRRVEKGEPREEAVAEVARSTAAVERINRQAASNAEQRRDRLGVWYRAEGDLNDAHLRIRKAVRIVQENNLEDEEARELLLHSIGQIEHLCSIARVAINGGELATDWDAAAAGILNPEGT